MSKKRYTVIITSPDGTWWESNPMPSVKAGLCWYAPTWPDRLSPDRARLADLGDA